MSKQIPYKKWLVYFFLIVIIIMTILITLAYIIDPFFKFRVKDNVYMLDGWFVSAGLTKNYDYDTYIIGSSMTQNFNMDIFREKLQVKPLHIGLGGITPKEINEYIDLAYKTGKAEQYYICVDLPTFTNEESSRNISYLMKDDLLSNLRYLLSYEVWFRYVPVDTALLISNKLNINLPLKVKTKQSIDKLEDWSLDHKFGKDIVIKNYLDSKYDVSEVDTNDLYNKMIQNFDSFISKFDFNNGKHVFFFPPYSSLFWCKAQDKEYYDTYLQVKNYMIKSILEKGGTVYDFQFADITTDLNNYKDITHYSTDINNWIVECFADSNSEYIVNENNIEQHQNKINENTKVFRSNNEELFNK